MTPVRPETGTTSEIHPLGWQCGKKSGGHLRNGRLHPSQRYDHTTAIWPQKWMPVRPNSSNRHDPSPANFMAPIKSEIGNSLGRITTGIKDVTTTTPARSNPENLYDGTSAKNTTRKKFVTVKFAMLTFTRPADATIYLLSGASSPSAQ